MAVLDDLCWAIRSASRAPLIPSLVSLLTACGLGLAIGMWALVDAVYLRPLPVPDEDRVVTVLEIHPERGRMWVAPANFVDLMAVARSFEALSGHTLLDSSFAGSGEPIRLTGAKVTSGYVPTMGLVALRGRTLGPQDYDVDDRVIMISERLWRGVFQGRDDVVGATARIDGEAVTIVGVLPATASAVGGIDYWVPWRLTGPEWTERRLHLVATLARLRDGVTPAEATRELVQMYSGLAVAHPETTRDWSAAAIPLREGLIEVPRRGLWLLSGAVAATFFVACLNVVALLGAWWTRRRAEWAIRLALGAAPRQIVSQLVAECALVTSVGTLAAFGVSALFVSVFGAFIASGNPRYDMAVTIDRRVAGAGVAFFGMTVLATAMAPASRVVSECVLVSGARATPRRRLGDRIGLVVQVAAALLLVTSALVLLEAMRRLEGFAPPVPPSRQAVEVALSDTRYPDDAAQRRFFEQVLDSLKAAPDVAAVGASSYLPPAPPLGNVRFEIVGRPASSEAHSAVPAAVDSGALALMGVRLLRGRLFDEGDAPDRPTVAIVSEALTRRYWGAEDAVGRQIRLIGLEPPVTIVGIVTNLQQPLSDDPRADTIVYLPYQQVPWPFMTLIVEPRGDAARAVVAVRQAVARLDPEQAVGPVRSLLDVQTSWRTTPRLQAAIVVLFGGTTLLIALAGLYARVVHEVGVRAAECAVRVALGATRRQIVTLLTTRTITAVLVGIGVGAALWPSVLAAIRAASVGVPPRAWGAPTLAAVLLLAAACAATVLPALRVREREIWTVLRRE